MQPAEPSGREQVTQLKPERPNDALDGAAGAEQILKTYAHLLPQSDELAAERVAAALAAGERASARSTQ
jgi:hypothetical protein